MKNLSFHVGPDGIALAPHYDLLSTGAYYTPAIAGHKASWPGVPMAFSLPDATLFGQVTLKAMLEAAAMPGVPERVARRVVSAMAAKLLLAFQSLTAELQAARAELPSDAKVFLGAQARLARVLEKMTYPDMLKRLCE